MFSSRGFIQVADVLWQKARAMTSQGAVLALELELKSCPQLYHLKPGDAFRWAGKTDYDRRKSVKEALSFRIPAFG
jgi:hypothetical protein